ncbi:hypothetical protein BZG36_03627 [Bifiguratus adelaidae]|uniref:BZIP domain-containing protein n=1 Tax=Bifiguratus adelaidae TaxID=1938954 RepID=A0A261Y063_9FUNG|nr:hypothetical protein BZG36_03627 [Bifiguratus adelaidae]
MTDARHIQTNRSAAEAKETPRLLFLNENDKTVTSRKKPGRKPKGTPVSVLKARNRLAQQAYRERKEHFVADLQDQLAKAKAQRDDARRKIKALEKLVGQLQSELLTHKDILLEARTTIIEHGGTRALEIDFLLNREVPRLVTQDMIANTVGVMDPNAMSEELKKLLADDDLFSPIMTAPDSVSSAASANLSPETVSGPYTPAKPEEVLTIPLYQANMSNNGVDLSTIPVNFMDLKLTFPLETEMFPESACPPPSSLDRTDTLDAEPKSYPFIPTYAALRTIHLQLIVQSIFPAFGHKNLIPTPLQLVTNHDVRINYLPMANVRDRILLFQDVLDIDMVTTALRCDSRCWGPEPFSCTSWELPESFFSTYWFLCDQELVDCTNRWRRRAGKEDVRWDPLGRHVTAASIGMDERVMGSIVKQMEALNVSS